MISRFLPAVQCSYINTTQNKTFDIVQQLLVLRPYKKVTRISYSIQVFTVPEDSQIQVTENHNFGVFCHKYYDRMIYVEKHDFQTDVSIPLSSTCGSSKQELNETVFHLTMKTKKPYRTFSIQPYIDDVTSIHEGEWRHMFSHLFCCQFYCLMHWSVTFYSHQALGIRGLWNSSLLCLTAPASIWLISAPGLVIWSGTPARKDG